MSSTCETPAGRVTLQGLPVDALTFDQTVDTVRSMVREGTPHQHVVVNAAKVVEAERDAELARIIRECDLVNADGTSVVWALRMLGRPIPERVTGIDLFERLVEVAAKDGHSVYFLGATDDAVTKVVDEFSRRHPTLRVAGFRNGFWDDDAKVVSAIRAAEPDYLFLGIPSPRKEFWLSEHLGNLGVPFVMGVGGSFDVVAGTVSRAPRWVQRIGLEWFWRLAQEPRRLWRRYLVGNTRFIKLTIREWRQARRARPAFSAGQGS